MSVYFEKWPYSRPLVISRASSDEAEVIVVECGEDGWTGFGECNPQSHFGESIESVMGQIAEVRPAIEAGADREVLQELLPAGAARNALDCALWGLEARMSGKRAWEAAGLPPPRPVTTVFTLSVGEPEEMAQVAAEVAHLPILKIKLRGEGDMERMHAVKTAAPTARLIVDANEAWTVRQLEVFAPELAEMGVELIEQPLPAKSDHLLAQFNSPVPLCADESCHTTADLERCVGRYEFVNIKLDKTGGLTEALRLLDAAERMGFRLMVGCMRATSMAMAPGFLIAQRCEFVDLDSPLLLATDRQAAMRYEGSTVLPPEAEVWA